MHVRAMQTLLVVFVLFSFIGGFGAQLSTASAADGDPSTQAAAASERNSVASPLSGLASERVYEVHKKVSDFPDREDLSTPEAAFATIHRAWAAEGDEGPFWLRLSSPENAARLTQQKFCAGVKQPLSKEKAEPILNAEILEVHIWDENRAAVIVRMPRKGHDLHLNAFECVNGRWLNEGNDLADTVEEARKIIAQGRSYVETKRLRDNRPPVADPAAYLQPFVDFLKDEAKDPQQFVLDAIGKHRVVIIGEIHHRPRYWAFDAALVRSPEFARQVGVIYMELPYNDQPLVERFLAASKYDPEAVIEMLRDVMVDGWPDQPMLDFFRTVWEVNQELPESQRLRIVLVNQAWPWKQIQNREDLPKYQVDRDQFMAENIARDLEEHAADKRHALFIVGYGHAMVNLTRAGGEPMKSAAWHLREKLGEANVFSVMPHGPVQPNFGDANGRRALGLFETAFAAVGNKPMAFPLDHGPFGKQIFDADLERVTADPYSKGYYAYLYLGPLEDEVFSPLIPGFYSDDFVQELDRRVRITDGKGMVEGRLVKHLDAASVTAWFGGHWGRPRQDWSADRLGPLEAWHYGSHYRDALLERVPSPQATTGKVIELYDIRSARESLANLAKGTVMAADFEHLRGIDPQSLAWLRENGIDLVAIATPIVGLQGIAGFEMAAVKIDNSRFDTLDIDEAKQALEKVDNKQNGVPGTIMSFRLGLPITYAIRTRDGSVGVLQIEDVRLSETPAVFRLRYKLFKQP